MDPLRTQGGIWTLIESLCSKFSMSPKSNSQLSHSCSSVDSVSLQAGRQAAKEAATSSATNIQTSAGKASGPDALVAQLSAPRSLPRSLVYIHHYHIKSKHLYDKWSNVIFLWLFSVNKRLFL